MSEPNTSSQPPSPVTGSPVDVVEAATQEALDKAKKRAEELASLVMEQQAPPGTPKLTKK